MEGLVEVTSGQLRMSETVLRLASDEEIVQLREICKSIADRAKAADREKRIGGAK